MRLNNNSLQFSATDLVGYLNCQALSAFDEAVAFGKSSAPTVWNPLLEVLWQRGTDHEAQYVEHLESLGLAVRVIEGTKVTDQAVEKTKAAMADGVDVIVQAALAHGAWVGRADILLKVEGSSDFGNWVYEPVDTKLARETKAGSVLQLCLYASLLNEMQGTAPSLSDILCKQLNRHWFQIGLGIRSSNMIAN